MNVDLDGRRPLAFWHWLAAASPTAARRGEDSRCTAEPRPPSRQPTNEVIRFPAQQPPSTEGGVHRASPRKPSRATQVRQKPRRRKVHRPSPCPWFRLAAVHASRSSMLQWLVWTSTQHARTANSLDRERCQKTVKFGGSSRVRCQPTVRSDVGAPKSTKLCQPRQEAS